MLGAVLPWSAALFGVALLFASWRLLRGPTVADRILALDTLYVNSIALLILIGIGLDTALYFEAALVIAMIGFIGTVAMARYLLSGNIFE
ncbi:MAG TPA: K+/H+ antiporter subunit F [Burkholderiaceae bacterium]|nr:K+/H+ antiporter subunit F [Burkholderiaceae bacterium]